MTDFDIRYATTATGGRVAYGVVGEGPMVIIPPNSLALSNFSRSPWAAARVEALPGYTVVMYDHLGAGLSDREGYDFSLDGLVGELEAVVDAIPAGGIALLAVNAAGPATIRYAAGHPGRVQALVLVETWARGADYIDRDSMSGYREALRGDWTFASQLFVRTVGLPSTEADAIALAALVRETCTQDDYLAFLDALATHDVTALLPDVVAPTLVRSSSMVGIRPAGAAQELAAAIPDAQLVLRDVPLWDDPALITQFLQRVMLDPEEGAAVSQGLQTILFTDLEASTALTQRLGDAAAQELLHGHNEAVRAALEEHGGREVKHTGDGIMASFPSAVGAVTAALQMQRELAGGEVRVRIGLNAGEPIAEDDDLFGLAVIKAARIADRADPGTVLVSDVVRQLCEGKTFEFTSVGEAALKGFDEPVALYEVRPGS